MERCRELYRIAAPEHMHVHRERLVAQQVIVQRRHLDPTLDELFHDWADLVHGQHQVAHHHAVVAHLGEREPAAEREAGLELDTVEGDLEIGARQADAVYPARHCRAGLTERLADAGLPVICG